MTDNPPKQAALPRLASWAIDLAPLLLGAWVVFRVLQTMLGRVDYPFDLEWMEGGMLGHAWQIAEGRPVYPDPEPGHVAFVYPPGYSALVATLGKVVGLDYAVGRWVSILGTLAGAAAIAVGARRQGGHWGPGLCGAAIYVSMFNASGAFYDLVRPDALAVALLGWAVVVGLEKHRNAPLVSGLLLVAAYVCKHNLAIFGLALLAHFWLRVGRGAAMRFAAWSIGPALAMTAWLEWTSGGNFLRFVVGVPASHGLARGRGFPGTQLELIHWFLPGLVAAAVYLWVRASQLARPTALALPVVLAVGVGVWAPGLVEITGGYGTPTEPWVRHLGMGVLGIVAGCLVAVPVDTALRGRLERRWAVAAVLAGVAILIASLMRAHKGGFINVLMPLHWVAAFGLAVLSGRARNRWAGVGPVALTAALAALNLGWTWQRMELDRLVPTAEDQLVGERVVAAITERCPEGPIYSPYAAWLPVQAGREPSAHLIGVWDINHERNPFFEDLETFREAAANHYWACVVEGGRSPLQLGLEKHYRKAYSFPVSAGVWMPKTGWRARPTGLLVPRAE